MGLVAVCLSCVLLLGSVAADDVCYDDLGCFTTDYPWTGLRRPLPNLPQPPAEIDTVFYLYTRSANETVITYNVTEFGDFSASRKTVLVLHGFSDDKEGWVNDIKDKLLEKDDYNVILVDWHRGATIPYLQATANTQLVARLMVVLLQNLVSSANSSLADMHCVGHSLGAHVCGYTGARLPGLGRITGMDPAQPYFEGTQPEVHLDATDALYVDNIHTDGRDTLFLGVGFKEANGDVDFFPNDGKNQPGCGNLDAEIKGVIWDLETLDLLAIGNELGCSHGRSHEFFLESLLEKPLAPLVAFQCPSYAEYLNGSCQHLQQEQMGLMGIDSVNFNLSGSYYLQTTADANAFRFRYFELTIRLSEAQQETAGNMIFVLNGNGVSSELLPGWSEQVSLTAGAELSTTVHCTADLGAELTSLRVTYHDHHGADARAMLASNITVRTVHGQLKASTQLLCGDGAAVPNQGSTEFQPCS